MSKPDLLVIGGRPEWYMDRLSEDFTVHRIANDDPSGLDPALAERIEAVTSAGIVGRRLIDALPRLGLVANGGAGYEKVDVEALRERGVALTNTPGVTDGCVADMAFALLLAVARHVTRGDRFVRAGLWPSNDYPLVPRLHGRPIGILGLGNIGLAIARRASGFDMPVFYHNRRARPDQSYTYCPSPRALAERVDFLVVACPGGTETRHLVDASVLEALGPGGIVVNIARGSIIDEEALAAALRDGRIMGAGLDVFENEPQVPDALLKAENAVLMPHRGGGTHETWQDACDLVKANILSYFRGEPLPTPVLAGEPRSRD
jgi:hydroxypyruvate reductase